MTDAQKDELENAFRRFLKESGDDSWREQFRERLLSRID